MNAATGLQGNIINEQPFKDGDMAIIIGRDGAVRNVSFGIDTSRLDGDPDDMTDEDLEVIEQGQKIFALTIAASTPMLMNILIEVASNPDVIDLETLKKFMRPN